MTFPSSVYTLSIMVLFNLEYNITMKISNQVGNNSRIGVLKLHCEVYELTLL